ncbi:NAD-binding protein [Halovenus sp. WSH3]|uniref:NAD-binding protein n=1 Tax=Halovenus carboxidivorans TaxID=2692199 RepID=A0A6B0T9Z8_9EURY|nr:NAD(P)-binding protein [Halovenus carboxidivorans]MXR50009.1 NAD-binding protein [Halovenus carboxidivorans]
MTRHVIIIGGGRVGRRVAEQLSEERNAVTIVERDHERCEQVSPKVHNVIAGDGTDDSILERAGLAEADVVAALTDDTGVNLEICETVSENGTDVRTILRISEDGERDYGHRRFVDEIVYPAAAAADVAVNRISRH